jgi:hypothetical protein
MTETPPVATEPEAKPKRQRVAAENRYPVFDLNSSLAVAKAVKEQGGDACSPEQLGAFLGYQNTGGGGFVARVSAAKQFGLIETVQGRYRSTTRAEAILWPVTPESRQRALVDAFLSVPLFKQLYDRHRNQRLPEEFGMRNLMVTQYGVPKGERAAKAYHVMMDSAALAGFFTATSGRRTHLIEPVMGTGVTGPDAQPDVSTSPNGEGPMPPSTSPPTLPGSIPRPQADRPVASSPVDPLPGVEDALKGLLKLIPRRGDPWPEKQRWKTIWSNTLDLLYPEEGRRAKGQKDETTP